jgi:hypothetical protein
LAAATPAWPASFDAGIAALAVDGPGDAPPSTRRGRSAPARLAGDGGAKSDGAAGGIVLVAPEAAWLAGGGSALAARSADEDRVTVS